ncbi:hypothetical protein PsYK624_134980 [Phanerochaete sordida]|uniref:Uncharacterized protein n=1 Tax=Phanerochaete sordida TaxID=48140 RepID=A0A9P3GKQ1_9APHY|nr:hypothetical protein PsYK624_134980 [Phanerochaete sordida]
MHSSLRTVARLLASRIDDWPHKSRPTGAHAPAEAPPALPEPSPAPRHWRIIRPGAKGRTCEKRPPRRTQAAWPAHSRTLSLRRPVAASRSIHLFARPLRLPAPPQGALRDGVASSCQTRMAPAPPPAAGTHLRAGAGCDPRTLYAGPAPCPRGHPLRVPAVRAPRR